MKKKHSQFNELKVRKESADRTWNYIYKDALNANINKVALVNAINTCNMMDKALLDLEYTNNLE